MPRQFRRIETAEVCGPGSPDDWQTGSGATFPERQTTKGAIVNGLRLDGRLAVVAPRSSAIMEN